MYNRSTVIKWGRKKEAREWEGKKSEHVCNIKIRRFLRSGFFNLWTAAQKNTATQEKERSSLIKFITLFLHTFTQHVSHHTSLESVVVVCSWMIKVTITSFFSVPIFSWLYLNRDETYIVVCPTRFFLFYFSAKTQTENDVRRKGKWKREFFIFVFLLERDKKVVKISWTIKREKSVSKCRF